MMQTIVDKLHGDQNVEVARLFELMEGLTVVVNCLSAVSKAIKEMIGAEIMCTTLAHLHNNT